jgi:hypothetical protein
MKPRIILLIVLAFVLLLAVPARAQTEPYTLEWWTVDGGGVTASIGGSYQLGGSIGQPDAATASGGAYALNGGFWYGAAPQCRVYLPMVTRP